MNLFLCFCLVISPACVTGIYQARVTQGFTIKSYFTLLAVKKAPENSPAYISAPTLTS